MSLPIPSINYMPVAFQNDPAMLALCDKMDLNMGQWKDDIKGMSSFIDVTRIPASCVDELGYMLSADILTNDAIDAKRRKIATAILRHKSTGSWIGDIKLLIDAQVGANSVLLSDIGGDDFILTGGGFTEIAGNFWAGIGGDGSALEYGIRLLGGIDYTMTIGIAAIDVDSSTLTFEEVANLVLVLKNHIPAYFRIILGYQVAGVFTPYANGTIG